MDADNSAFGFRLSALSTTRRDSQNKTMNAPQDSSESFSSANSPLETDDDPLYGEAVLVVATNKRASVSLVQRHLRIGYNRASSLLVRMERDGLVSPMGPSGNRTILPRMRESSYAYNLARAAVSSGGLTPERAAFEREFAYEAQPSVEEVRGMVEDTWRQFLGFAAQGLRDLGEGVITRFDAKVQAMASRMAPDCAQEFLADVEAERASILKEYTASPSLLKKRLGVGVALQQASRIGQPPPLMRHAGRSNRQGIGETAAKTAVRALIWNVIRSIFR